MIVAVRGYEGVEMAAKHMPDLILLDLDLPDIHGREVLQILRENPALAHTPVIVVSADATPSQVERLLGDGAVADITKPLDVNRFLTILGDTCDSLEKKVA